ncbi:MAG: SPFH domain-containing protein [Armatimonadota bacterium]|nr:SPFH domain-containing protein [Armatimonadota bacterium]
MSEGAIVGVAIVAFFVLILFASAIKVAPEYQRVIVFRLGRVLGAKGPGLVLLIPFADRAQRVDLRENYFDVPPQSAITKDNAGVAIDFYVYMKVVDALLSVVQVYDFFGAARGIAITTLRAVVGSMLLDDVLANREAINETLRVKLDEVTNRWGIKVTAVEIREIVPPREVQEAMTRQMSAERSRRATVLEAEGKREAAVNVAEGEKQATILRAEGEKQATVLRADGDRQARVLQAEGYATGLQKVYEVAQGVDSNTMSIQYLDALRALGATDATKIVVPLELMKLVEPLTDHARKAMGDKGE